MKDEFEWIKVDKFGACPEKLPVLTSDVYGNVDVAFTSFEYYDAEFWFPMPKYPMADPVITNEICVQLLLKGESPTWNT